MLVHHVEEVLQDLEVEGGSEHLPPGSSSSSTLSPSSSPLPGVPLAAGADEEASPQPRQEKLVILALHSISFHSEEFEI